MTRRRSWTTRWKPTLRVSGLCFDAVLTVKFSQAASNDEAPKLRKRERTRKTHVTCAKTRTRQLTILSRAACAPNRVARTAEPSAAFAASGSAPSTTASRAASVATRNMPASRARRRHRPAVERTSACTKTATFCARMKSVWTARRVQEQPCNSLLGAVI